MPCYRSHAMMIENGAAEGRFVVVEREQAQCETCVSCCRSYAMMVLNAAEGWLAIRDANGRDARSVYCARSHDAMMVVRCSAEGRHVVVERVVRTIPPCHDRQLLYWNGSAGIFW